MDDAGTVRNRRHAVSPAVWLNRAAHQCDRGGRFVVHNVSTQSFEFAAVLGEQRISCTQRRRRDQRQGCLFGCLYEEAV